jgi:hypothetical protein
MKNKSHPTSAPSDEAIRDYAYHLYQQSSCEPGHDLDNWLEAAACLKANIPAHRSSMRLHWYANDPESGMDNLLAADARTAAPAYAAFRGTA